MQCDGSSQGNGTAPTSACGQAECIHECMPSHCAHSSPPLIVHGPSPVPVGLAFPPQLCGGNSVGEVWEELCGGTVSRTIASSCSSTMGIPHYSLTNCPLSHPQQQPGIGEGACTPVTRWSRHTHTIASSTPNTRGIPHCLLSNCPPPVLAHSSSQVVHCRVCPPHPLHAPVLVLHLAVYPASPTQGRVGSLTGCYTVHRHSAN